MICRLVFDRRKQVARAREGLQKLAETLANGKAGRFAVGAKFLASVNEDAILPINVLGGQTSGVGLSGSGFVEQPIVCAALGIAFATDDLRMLLGRDSAFALTADFRPSRFR